MEKVSAACAMEWSIKLEKSLHSKNPVRTIEAIFEAGRKLEQWSKEPESAIAVYNLFGLIPEEDKLFSNTILLRLVDAFCIGVKLVKLAVVRVFMSMFKLSRGKNVSESANWFLSKDRVHNHLEILKRVKNVYEKGDTEAKALALILFGCWRDFASEFAPVRSALFAAACFCEVADDFALVVLGMLNEMVTFPALIPKTRLAAVRVFSKMGCSRTIANRAFKILVYKLCMADKSELHQLIAIVEKASHSRIFSSCLAISILAGIWKEIVRIADIRLIDISSTSLTLQLVELIMDRVTLLGKLCSDPSQVDYEVVGGVQDLFRTLLLIVGKRSIMRLLVLDKVMIFVEYIVNLTGDLRKTGGANELLLGIINHKGKRGEVVRSELLAAILKFLIVFLENHEGDGSQLSQVYEKVKHITENMEIQVSRLLTVNYGIVALDCSNQILMEGNYWPAYRAGVYAARLGAWVTSALIFDQLKTNLQSDNNCFWLKSLSYLSHAEAKLQLLRPRDSFKLVNWLRSSGNLPELSKNAYGEFAHCVAVREAYMNLQSSLGMLGNIITSRNMFCFQTWFLVLKTRLLETVINLVEDFGLLNQDICKKKQMDEEIFIELQQLPRISIQLEKLAKEFDLLAMCFIDIDDSRAGIIATLSLSCSVLAFAAGIVIFLPRFSFHEALAPFTSQSSLGSRLVQDLIQRLGKVDPEICEKLRKLVKVNESLNCFHLQPRIQVLRVCGKVKMLRSICRDTLACIDRSQNQSISMHKEGTMSEITKSCRNLQLEAIMKWTQISFGIPKSCVGAELFAVSSDSSKNTSNTVSVEQGFQLSMDLCLQLKNLQQPRAPVRLTKLYCVLYSKLAYQTSTQNDGTNKDQKSYSP